MGNDSSRLKGLVIDKNAVEANDFWSLFNAEHPTTSNDEGQQLLSVFIGESVVNGQLWLQQAPMERAIKNFMIYRHPYILKYVCTWVRSGQKHLATERVRPLTAVSTTLSDIQICLGLRTILCSLIFLTEKAMARHLNICSSSIYITDNGSWRLAGFEFVWKSKDINKSLLELAKSFRYQPAIDPSETKQDQHADYIEQYAFATLCEEILSKHNNKQQHINATPHVQEFREYCATHLKHKNAQLRPKLSAVLLHPYFNHEFVLIHSFLFELPLKSVQEKQEFFTGLIDRLRYFNEQMVAAQLAADLLSRMVLLDPTAQLCVTPYVLKTKTDHSAALFSNQTYTRYLMPHILRMFRLRDAQIRLILLEYFTEFVRLLSKQELEELILPHLHAGMNDTNDVLVAKTLRCLADLVPILGATIVIGGNRMRLFSDGRPQAAVADVTTHWVEPRSITPVMGDNVDYMVSDSPLPETVDLSGSFNSIPQDSEQLEMPPRLSPDGGEDVKADKSITAADQTLQNDALLISDFVLQNVIEAVPLNINGDVPKIDLNAANATVAAHTEEEESAWSDWETDELQRLNGNGGVVDETSDAPTNLAALPPYNNNLNASSTQNLLATGSSSFATIASLTDSFRTTQSNNSSLNSLKPSNSSVTIIDDLSALDIKVQRLSNALNEQSNEFDFFKDMEPVIQSKPSCLLHVALESSTDSRKNAAAFSKAEEEIVVDHSRFAAESASMAINDGWGVEEEEDVGAWQN